MKFYPAEAVNSAPSITSSSVVHNNASGLGTITSVILLFASGYDLPKVYATNLFGEDVLAAGDFKTKNLFKDKASRYGIDGSHS